MIFELSGSRLRVVGTLHLLPPTGTLPAWVRSAYDWSEAVFVEHSPVDFLRLAQVVETPRAESVSPAFWSRLQGLAATLPLPLERLQLGAAVVLALGSRVQGIAGVDSALHDWCARDRKTFGFIEQAAELLQALDGVSESEWATGLDAEMRLAESPATQLQRFYDLWRKGRLDGIAAASRRGLFSVAAIRRQMLAGRNRAWAARYTEPAQRTLVAVGAAHLVGEGNLLEELARVSGRPVRRIV